MILAAVAIFSYLAMVFSSSDSLHFHFSPEVAATFQGDGDSAVPFIVLKEKHS